MSVQKGGIIIENKVAKLKALMECDENHIIKQVLNNVLHLNIKEIKYDKNLKLSNISEYEFELIKVKAMLETDEEIEIYLKIIKNSRIKESIFCYWCTIYEEELMKAKELDNMDVIINKVAISELKKSRYQESIFLTIENNRTPILESGTEVSFIEIRDYIEDKKDEYNELEKLYEYFDRASNDVLLVGIKMKQE